ncbi:(2Fe-2S)-binding protein [Falsiroseomonas stagni]|uniref:Isoquinoline 1-oxidoreductase, alpha subunit n=1 Tax=Falsiroseomonas stagni DSM 19981 TaxID=1123062 RepID=A0A1I4DV49_9PROT|nr:(2Fe-2S)-binding protein [Falsiroseomonas stagni]SFK96923.1 isoquinoline 1-oxidoreductase, alpha subunit [Falsiroseomonas stagni DSM 19981]
MAKLNVNGRVIDVQVEDDTPLLWVLREQLELTGTKYGCGIAQCGACTVHVDGVATRSCAMPVSAFDENQKIVTIEGLSPDSSHPIQQAWLALDVPQCGFCQSGMIMAAAALLAATPRPTEQQIRDEVTNICRCGTYNRVLAGIQRAAGTAGAAG